MARGFASLSRDHLRTAAADGVITAQALVALGVPESTIYHRCRDGGPWQRLAPGVILMTTGHPTTGQLNPADYEREQERTARFVAAGVPVLPTQPARLRSDARAVLDELCGAYGHAASRPRPAVRATRRS